MEDQTQKALVGSFNSSLNTHECNCEWKKKISILGGHVSSSDKDNENKETREIKPSSNKTARSSPTSSRDLQNCAHIEKSNIVASCQAADDKAYLRRSETSSIGAAACITERRAERTLIESLHVGNNRTLASQHGNVHNSSLSPRANINRKSRNIANEERECDAVSKIASMGTLAAEYPAKLLISEFHDRQVVLTGNYKRHDQSNSSGSLCKTNYRNFTMGASLDPCLSELDNGDEPLTLTYAEGTENSIPESTDGQKFSDERPREIVNDYGEAKEGKNVEGGDMAVGDPVQFLEGCPVANQNLIKKDSKLDDLGKPTNYPLSASVSDVDSCKTLDGDKNGNGEDVNRSGVGLVTTVAVSHPKLGPESETHPSVEKDVEDSDNSRLTFRRDSRRFSSSFDNIVSNKASAKEGHDMKNERRLSKQRHTDATGEGKSENISTQTGREEKHKIQSISLVNNDNTTTSIMSMQAGIISPPSSNVVVLAENNTETTSLSYNEPPISFSKAAPLAMFDSPEKRKRARSLSSAFSSISGDDCGDSSIECFHNDWKTPVKTNRTRTRKQSTSTSAITRPVKKRHHGRMLFNQPDCSIGEKIAGEPISSMKCDCGLNSNPIGSKVVQNSTAAQKTQAVDINEKDVTSIALNQSIGTCNDSIESSGVLEHFHPLMPHDSTIPRGVDTSNVSSEETDETGHSRSDPLNVFTSPLYVTRRRNRSDTIEFLSSVVGCDLENISNETLAAESNHLSTTDLLEPLHLTVSAGLTGSDINSCEGATTCAKAEEKYHGRDHSYVGQLKTQSGSFECFGDTQQLHLNSIHLKEEPDDENAGETGTEACMGESIKSSEIVNSKTPVRTNCSRSMSLSFSADNLHGPLRKRFRTGSLSLFDSGSITLASAVDPIKEINKQDYSPQMKHQDNEAHSTWGNEKSVGRLRSDTIESVQNIVLGRERSDTIDLITAAVARDMDQNLNVAEDAVADQASFSMHSPNVPSGSSVSFAANTVRPVKRPRSDTLDSTTSSSNSSKLDYLVAVAADEGVLALSAQDTAECPTLVASSDPIDNCHGRPRSNTLEIYSNMTPNQSKGESIDFFIGPSEGPVGAMEHTVPIPGNDGASSIKGCVLEQLKALCDEPNISEAKSAIPIRPNRRSNSENASISSSVVASSSSQFGHGNGSFKRIRSNSEATSKTCLSLDVSSQQLISESIQLLTDERRDRLDSWGAMSDLSVAGMDPSAIAATHSALKSTGIIDDIMAAAADLDKEPESKSVEHKPSKHSVSATSLSASNTIPPKGRPRIDSLASLSLASLSDASISIAESKNDFSVIESAEARSSEPHNNSSTDKESPLKECMGSSMESLSNMPGNAPSIVVDYDAIAAAVHAANAATEGLDLNTILNTPAPASTVAAAIAAGSKVCKPLILGKTAVENKKRKVAAVSSGSPPRNQKLPTNSASCSAGSEPTLFQSMKFTKRTHASASSDNWSAKKENRLKLPVTTSKATVPKTSTASERNLSVKTGISLSIPNVDVTFVPIPKSTKTKEEMDAIRERARAAAGYTPPVHGIITDKKPQPRKPLVSTFPSKFSKAGALMHQSYHLTGPSLHCNAPVKKRAINQIPLFNPTMQKKLGSITAISPPRTKIRQHSNQRSSSSANPKSGVLQSQQKWDDMFQCLIKFIEENRLQETEGMSKEDKANWVWDGNVPTNYRTKCGRALGRWINNQRSAKAKGSLKGDREVRLVSTGLKWSVLTTNSWKDMLRELEIYVSKQTKDGRVWDGNVPTNYKIRSNVSSAGNEIDEEKNLGRWINRQRSLFQAGKLKKDRQLDLERIGLKWSVLLTTSWSSMYESLCAYVEAKRKENADGFWDGNVPANHKTETNPPLSLGRWVNRQRTAHAKGRLKKEFVDKLERIGLKWVVHERRKNHDREDEDEFEEEEEFIQGDSMLINKPDVSFTNNENVSIPKSIQNISELRDNAHHNIDISATQSVAPSTPV